MRIEDKLENKIEEFLKEIEELRGENILLKLQLKSMNKTKSVLEQNNQEIHSKMKLALQQSDNKDNL